MEIIGIDFETYYDKDYSLTKLTTEQYIRDPRFEVIMVGIRMPDENKFILTGTHEEIKWQLDRIDWSQYAVVAHNAMFDAAILSWVFGIVPKAWLDTLGMSRAMFGGRGNSLAALAKRYNMEEKGTEVHNMMGRTRTSLTPYEFQQYAKYCLHDTDLCYDLFHLMANGWYDLESVDKRDNYPMQELQLIDVILRMYIEPVLRLNKDKLVQHLADVQKRKEDLLSASSASKDELMSNPKFAGILESFGVSPPMKISPTTGKAAFAFAKTDPGMKALLEHPDERVQAVVAARMGVKSTLEETRTLRFIDIADRGAFPVPLKYSAARTHRLGGMDKINLQNLPARGLAGNKLKSCIEAPPGYAIIDCDSSNIEARVLAWLAGQVDLVADFANNVDVYCKMASRIYSMEVTKENKQERFVGKTVILGCFGPDTQVLTDSGVKSIIRVSLADKLWDGESWVTHRGLLNQGYRVVETPMDSMLSATADHEILTEHGWRAWSEVHSNPSLFLSALNRATLPLSRGSNNLGQMDIVKDGTPAFAAYADGKDLCTVAISSIKKLPGAVLALGSSLAKRVNTIGATQTLWQMTPTESAYLTGSQKLYTGAQRKHIGGTQTTVAGGLECSQNGLMIGVNSYSMWSVLKGGITQSWRWIESTITKGTNLTILGGPHAGRICLTGVTYKTCKKNSTVLKQRMQTYDIALAGPNNRFTVITSKGPLIVHNCGYQTGKIKLQATLKAATPPMELDIDRCDEIIKAYRQTYNMIPLLWRQGDVAIEAIYHNREMWLGKEGVLRVEGKKGIRLPNGLYISYPMLHRVKDDNGRDKWQYKDTTGLIDIYGGKLIENVVQALARIVVTQQLLKIAKRYKVVLTVHDAVACIAKKEESSEARDFVEECMRWVPKWAAGCPINCESGIGEDYGAC